MIATRTQFNSRAEAGSIPVRLLQAELQGSTGIWLREDYLTHPDSVQVRYRPVLQQRVPDAPEPGDTTSESVRWWAREYRRSTRGWLAPDGVWFNPIAYWYFNHGSIDYVDDDGEEHETTPLYSDADKEVLDDIWNCLMQTIDMAPPKEVLPPQSTTKKLTRKQRSLINKQKFAAMRAARTAGIDVDKLVLRAEDYVITKGRRKHWSYNTLCAVFMWAFCVHQNGNLGAGFDSKLSREEGQRIFRAAYDRLHPMWKHRELYNDREGQLSACEYIEDAETGQIIKKRGTTIFFSEMDKRVGAFRGKRLRILLFDEAGKYVNLGRIIGASRDCLRVGQNKFGTMLIGGTCDPITNKSQDYQNLWKRSLSTGYSRRFVPAWKMAPPFVCWFTGANLEKYARLEYELERKQFLDAGDSEQHALTVQENPLDEHELFILPTLSNYPPHQLLAATHRIAQYGDNLPVVRVRLEWEYNTFGKRTGKVYPEVDPLGKWLMHKDYQPRKDIENLDVMGIDSVYKDVVTDSDSKCSIVLYRRFNHRLELSDYPALIYYDRPLLDGFADEVKKVMVWTGCRAILELVDKFIADEIIKEKVPSEKGLVTLSDQLIYFNGVPGFPASLQAIVTQTGLALKWIKDGGLTRVVFQQIVDSLKNWRQKNDDIASAFHSALMGVDTLRETLMEEDEDKADLAPLGMGFNNALLMGTGQVNLAVAFGYGGDGFAPMGLGNSAYGNPMRKGLGAGVQTRSTGGLTNPWGRGFGEA